MKFVSVLVLLIIVSPVYSQLSSNKSGDITYNDQVIAEVEKYGGNSQVKPKFRVVTSAKDTLMNINFKKDLDFDWMQFKFKNTDKIIEVEYNEIITGLNYRKNIGNFLVTKNLIKQDGTLNDTAFQSFQAKHTDNLTEKYVRLNEFNRKVINTKFEYSLSDNKLVINGKHVGFATVPDGQGLIVENMIYYDVNMKVIGKGGRGTFGDIVMAMNDGKTFNTKVDSGDTRNAGNKMILLSGLLRELTKAGYYQF